MANLPWQEGIQLGRPSGSSRASERIRDRSRLGICSCPCRSRRSRQRHIYPNSSIVMNCGGQRSLTAMMRWSISALISPWSAPTKIVFFGLSVFTSQDDPCCCHVELDKGQAFTSTSFERSRREVRLMLNFCAPFLFFDFRASHRRDRTCSSERSTT